MATTEPTEAPGADEPTEVVAVDEVDAAPEHPDGDAASIWAAPRPKPEPEREPDAVQGPAVVPGRASRHDQPRAGRIRRLWPPTGFGLFSVGFLFLIGSAGAIAAGQFLASPTAPWVSVGLSAAAVILTVAALFRRSGR